MGKHQVMRCVCYNVRKRSMFFQRKKFRHLASTADIFFVKYGEDIFEFRREDSKWIASKILPAQGYFKLDIEAPVEREARVAASRDVLAFLNKSHQGLYIFRQRNSAWHLEQEISRQKPLAGLNGHYINWKFTYLSLNGDRLAFCMQDAKNRGNAIIGWLTYNQGAWQLEQIMPLAEMGSGFQADKYFYPYLMLTEKVLAVGRIDSGIWGMVELCLLRRDASNCWQVEQRIDLQNYNLYEEPVDKDGSYFLPDLALCNDALALPWHYLDKSSGKWTVVGDVFRHNQGRWNIESRLSLSSLDTRMHPFFQQNYSEESGIMGLLFADTNTLFIDFMKLGSSSGAWQLENVARAPERLSSSKNLKLDYWTTFRHGGASLLQITKEGLHFYHYTDGYHELEQIIRAEELSSA